MECKPYQNQVLEDLATYLKQLEITRNLKLAFREYWKSKIILTDETNNSDDFIYKDNIKGVPNLCIKVPTAGGKTFIACNALKVLFDFYQTNSKAVLWLVPSITILEQTIKNLSDSKHPYRQKINTHFQGKVEVYSKEQILHGINFNPTSVLENLNIIVLSFDTIRIRKKEDRKIYQENGQLASFAFLNNKQLNNLPEIDETALINVIRNLKPIVIVDESHNATSELSLEMLKDVNPSFILDLTATPRKNSNIISYVHAGELKKENMVKLPVIVSNLSDKDSVIHNAIQLQKRLEKIALEEEKKSGKYIRPIVLFQAQPKNKDDSTTFQKLKQSLIDLMIPDDQIKIKTAEINEIKGIDLLSKNCNVRYIITIDALKEGWDCPFAYILASLADKNSPISVEQILGRILRQPYVFSYDAKLLNMSYVFTASSQFQKTLEFIVKGLNNVGYSSKDCKVLELKEIEVKSKPVQTTFNFQETINEKKIKIVDSSLNDHMELPITEFEQRAIIESEIFFETTIQNISISELSTAPIELKESNSMSYKDVYKDKLIDVKLPRYYMTVDELGLFGKQEDQYFQKEILLKDFKLSSKDTEINFEEVDPAIYQIDIENTIGDDYHVKYEVLDKSTMNAFKTLIQASTPSAKIREMTAQMQKLIGSIWPISEMELEKYLLKIFENFTPEQFIDCIDRQYIYKEKIKQKISLLSSEFVKERFEKLTNSGIIYLRYDYMIPNKQSPGDLFDYGIRNSLYIKEHRMNEFEKEVINKIANLDNILLWTKNSERSGFCLNGYINHYPDFILITKKGKKIILETKGDHLNNPDTELKIELGRQWASKAGDEFRYFLVFKEAEVKYAFKVEKAIELIKDL